MSDRNFKFRRYTTRIRRRSRAGEIPDTFSSFRDPESGLLELDSEGSGSNDVQNNRSDIETKSNDNGSDDGDRLCAADDGDSATLEEREDEGSSSSNTKPLECAICLQPCVHPARLPCRHIFCFLCLKGIARGPHTCAMCRAPIPLDYTDNPDLVPVSNHDSKEPSLQQEYTWYYEGRDGSGWWQYDSRTSAELEQCYQRNEMRTEVLIAGYLYNIDLEQMVQSRKNEPARKRTIKRDLVSRPKKGIAGLRQPLLTGLNETLSALNLNN